MSYLLWIKTLSPEQAAKTLGSCQKGIERNLVEIRRGFLRRGRTTTEQAQKELINLPPQTLITYKVYSPERFGHTKQTLSTGNSSPKLQIVYWFNPSKQNH